MSHDWHSVGLVNAVHDGAHDMKLLHITPRADGSLYCFVQDGPASNDYSYTVASWAAFMSNCLNLSDFEVSVHAPETPRDIVITSADKQTFTIQFHRTAYKCWHVVFPSYVMSHRISAGPNDYVYTGLNGGVVLASGSLERAMAAIGEQIASTEF